MTGLGKVGRALAVLRKRSGLSREEVAERLGRSVSAVARLEQEGINPRASSIDRFLEAVGCTVSDLAGALRGEYEEPARQAPSAGAAEPSDLEKDVAWLMREVVALREDFGRFRDDVSLRILHDAETKTKAGDNGPPSAPDRKRDPRPSGE